jgi:hypothetical protein
MRGKMMLITILAVFSMAALTGCGFVADGPFGWALTKSKTPVTVGSAKTGPKQGKACIHAYFGLLSVGDASIEAAMKPAGIKEIYAVHNENLSILGTYTRQCTVVSGE